MKIVEKLWITAKFRSLINRLFLMYLIDFNVATFRKNITIMNHSLTCLL